MGCRLPIARPRASWLVVPGVALLALLGSLVTGGRTDAAEPAWTSLTVTNPGAEDGTTGWTGSVLRNDLDPGQNVCGINTPNSGTYYWCQDGPAYQDISLAGFSGAIDAGRFRVHASGAGNGNTSLLVQWRSGADTLLGSSPAAIVDTGAWITVSTNGFVPAGTRTARVLWDGMSGQTSSFDDVEAGYCTTPDAAVNGTPASGGRSTTKPTFTWSGQPDANGYQVQVATDAAFANIVLDRRIASVATTFTSDVTLPGGGQLWWRVRGTSVCGDGSWSSGTFFYTDPFAFDRFVLSDTVTHSTTLTNNVTVAVDLENLSRVGATAYYVSSAPETPLASAPDWTSSPPTRFPVPAGDGLKTLYAWAKDANDVVSSRATAQIALDTAGPRVRATAPAFTRKRLIALAVTATDLHGVAKYAVTQTPTPPTADSALWKPSAPTAFSLAGVPGVKSVYVFAMDAAGNVGSKSVRVTLDMAAPKATVTAPKPGVALAALTTIAGKFSDPAPASGLKKASFAILKTQGCLWWNPQKHALVPGACGTKLWFGLAATATWSRTIGKLDAPGRYRRFVAVEDRAGNKTQVTVDFTIAP